jgi:hypothetical protein
MSRSRLSWNQPFQYPFQNRYFARLWLDKAVARMEPSHIAIVEQFNFQMLRGKPRQIPSDDPEIARIGLGF